MKRLVAVLSLVFILVSLPSLAFGWKTLKTDHFTIFYEPGYEAQAWEFLRTLEHHRLKVERLTGNTALHLPSVIEDAGTISNGSADPVNYRTYLYTYSPSAGGLGGALENWPTYVGVHEYTHILHITKVSGFYKAITALFGRYLSPNAYSLGWAVEGITVYSESQLSKYQGRLNDGYYDAYIGARIRDNRFPSILGAAYSPLEYPYYDGIYNYGGEFFNYLSKTYSEDKFASLFQKIGSRPPLFNFGSSAKKVYGKSFPRLWREWKAYEYNRFKNFRMEGERLTQHGWWVSDLTSYNDKLYYTRIYVKKTGPFETLGFSRIIERDIQTVELWKSSIKFALNFWNFEKIPLNLFKLFQSLWKKFNQIAQAYPKLEAFPKLGEEKTIVSTTSFFTAPIRTHNGKLYYAVGETKPGYANVSELSYGIYSVVHERDLITGEDRVILKEGIRNFEILNDGNLIYSKDRKIFGSEIVLYDINSKEKKTYFDTDYLVDRIISDGNRIVVSARRDWENFSLYSLDLEKQNFTPIINAPYFEGSHSLFGDKLFFSANYEGVYSAYCYDFTSGKVYRLTENGYAVYPVYYEKSQSLYYIGLNSYGYDIYTRDIEWKEFQIPDYPATSPPVFSLSENDVRRGGYFDNIKTIGPKLRLPLYKYDKEKKENRLGVLLVGVDTLSHFPYFATLWYDFESKEPFYDVTLTARLLAPFVASVSSSNTDTKEKKQLAFDLQYPLISRLSPGLSSLSTGLSSRLFNDFNRHELKPYLKIGFRFPMTNLDFTLSSPLERKEIGSDINRAGFKGEANLSQYIRRSGVNFKIAGIYDPDSTYDPEKDDPDASPFPVIRGYEEPLDAKIGTAFSVDLSAPILPIRWGIWFPPYVFFEDLCGGIFFDGAIPKEGKDRQFSTGLELHLETRLASLMPLDLGIRFLIDRDSKFKYDFIATVPITME